jgi:diadenosine tetraphosphatase ApaH/serine/threonine PP2A family protein phosphatase
MTEGRFLFVHGSPRDPIREYVLSSDGILNPEKLRTIFSCFEGVALAGHTHQPGVHDSQLRFQGMNGQSEMSVPLPEGEQFFINVGSTGQPRDGDPRACYAVLEEHRLSWFRVPYDYRTTMMKIQDTGQLSEMLARRLAVGK